MQYFDLEKIFGAPLSEVDAIIADMKSNIRVYNIPKKDGKMRQITAPSEKLKNIQRNINYNVFYRYRPSQAAHGFVRNRSVVSGAKAHVAQRSVLGCDIEGFFDHITPEHAKNCLFGNDNLCRICKKCGEGCSVSLYSTLSEGFDQSKTCAEILAVHDPEFVKATGYQSLLTRVIALTTYNGTAPQGFPTSPALANIVMKGFDKWMLKQCSDHTDKNLAYTRYADDITVSSSLTQSELGALILKPIMRKLYGFGFRLKKSKTRINGSGRRQEVTGVIVNSGKTSLGRHHVMHLRARVHLVVSGRLALDRHEIMELKGHCAYLAMVAPKHKRYLDRISRYVKNREFVKLDASIPDRILDAPHPALAEAI